jgi:hypothetical protein
MPHHRIQLRNSSRKSSLGSSDICRFTDVSRTGGLGDGPRARALSTVFGMTMRMPVAGRCIEGTCFHTFLR